MKSVVDVVYVMVVSRWTWAVFTWH